MKAPAVKSGRSIGKSHRLLQGLTCNGRSGRLLFQAGAEPLNALTGFGQGFGGGGVRDPEEG